MSSSCHAGVPPCRLASKPSSSSVVHVRCHWFVVSRPVPLPASVPFSFSSLAQSPLVVVRPRLAALRLCSQCGSCCLRCPQRTLFSVHLRSADCLTRADWLTGRWQCSAVCSRRQRRQGGWQHTRAQRATDRQQGKGAQHCSIRHKRRTTGARLCTLSFHGGHFVFLSIFLGHLTAAGRHACSLGRVLFVADSQTLKC
jgi:hypothetical protein